MAAHRSGQVKWLDGERQRRLDVEFISANYFAVFGAPLWKGRSFAGEEEGGMSTPVVIVSYHFWKKQGANPDMVGSILRLNGHSFTVIGVTLEGFTGRLPYTCPDLWLPLGMYSVLTANGGSAPSLQDRQYHFLLLVGQLKAGLKATQAEPQLRGWASCLEQDYPAGQKQIGQI